MITFDQKRNKHDKIGAKVLNAEMSRISNEEIQAIKNAMKKEIDIRNGKEITRVSDFNKYNLPMSEARQKKTWKQKHVLEDIGVKDSVYSAIVGKHKGRDTRSKDFKKITKYFQL